VFAVASVANSGLGSRECLQCGFIIDDREITDCPKCDAVLGKQTDGSIRTVDIAHHQETLSEAVDKLRKAVNRHRKGKAESLRVIVGGGIIREGIIASLNQMRARRLIKDYQPEKGNSGAYVLKLK